MDKNKEANTDVGVTDDKKSKKDKKKSEKHVKNVIDTSPTLDELNDSEIDEALTTQQRMKRSRIMRKNKAKIAAGRRRSAKKRPTREKIIKRSQKRARNEIRKKLLGKSGKSYKDMSMSQRQAIDKRVSKRKGVINRLAKKIAPKIRREEFDADLNEEFDIFITEASERDTRPKKRYHQMLDKNGTPKIDKRLKPFRKKKKSVDEDVESLRKKHKKERSDLSQDHEKEMDDAKAREKRKEIKSLYREDIDIDEETLRVIDEIWDSIQLEEKKIVDALAEKSSRSGIPYKIPEEVYDRGCNNTLKKNENMTYSQMGMARVSNFIANGVTAKTCDRDLWEEIENE